MPTRVAVVAVHGVGSQQPNETAQSIADLLARSGNYGGFTQKELRIGVAPVVLDWREGHATPSGVFEERPSLVRMYQRQQAFKSAAAPSEPFDHVYMYEQLADYKLSEADSVYATVRLEGSKVAADGTVLAEVHVHELYWGDLSRLGGTVVTFFTELYLLLFFICQLGRRSIDSLLGTGYDPVWEWCRRLQSWAERLLTRFIPVLNLYLLALTACVLPFRLTGGARALAATVVPGLTTTVLLGCVIYGLRAKTRDWFSFLFWLVLLIGAYVTLFIAGIDAKYYPQIIMLSVWVLSFTGLLFLMRAFNKRQPGVLLVAVVAGIPITAMYGWHVVKTVFLATEKEVDAGLADGTLWTAEVIYLALSACWVLFVALSLLTALLGVWGIWRVPAAQRGPAWRVAWTVFVSLAMPSMFFLIVTMAVWAALLQVGSNWVPLSPHRALLSWPRLYSPTSLTARECAGDLVLNAASPWFYFLVLLFMVFLLWVGWALLPAALADRRPPTTARDEDSKWLGRALTSALRLIVGVGIASLLLLVVGLPIELGLEGLLGPSNPYADFSKLFLTAVGAVLILMVAAKGPFKPLALGSRAVLDIILDVANWLRYFPYGQNPRSRICARYVSLLRHVCLWMDSNGKGYDALIIIAHSQGTVVTADLLRFLKREQCRRPDPGLARIDLTQPGPRQMPVRLLTMGCPLRQLYSWPLPFLYGWARHDGTPFIGSIPPKRAPLLDELLGVVGWTNAYGSGDYVGRNLWRSDEAADLFAVFPANSAGHAIEEFCVGPRAHQHYWDGTAPGIAETLSRMIS